MPNVLLVESCTMFAVIGLCLLLTTCITGLWLTTFFLFSVLREV